MIPMTQTLVEDNQNANNPDTAGTPVKRGIADSFKVV